MYVKTATRQMVPVATTVSQMNATHLCSIWNISLRLCAGQQGVLCEYSQSERPVLRCMALAQSMTFNEYVRVYLCAYKHCIRFAESVRDESSPILIGEKKLVDRIKNGKV